MGTKRDIVSMKKGLIFAVIALSLMLVSEIVYLLSDVFFFETGSEGMTAGRLVLVGSMNTLVTLMWIASIVLLLIWLIKWKRPSSRLETKLGRDINLALWLLVGYVIFEVVYLFVLAPVMGLLAGSNFVLHHYLTSYLGITTFAVFLMIFILSIIRLARGKERWLALAGIIMLVIGSYQIGTGPWEGWNLPLAVFETVWNVLAWTLILLCFIFVMKGMDKLGPDLDTPFYREAEKSYAKGGWRGKFTRVVDNRPWVTIIALAVILVIPSVTGYLRDRDELDREEWTTIGYLDLDDEEVPTGTVTESLSDRAQEGEPREYGFDMEPSADRVQVMIKWEDEPDTLLWENQPETFEVTIEHLDGQEEKTATNPKGGTGEIDFSFEPDSKGGGLQITVLLADSGNYERPVGPGFLERTDGFNDFDLTVSIEYPEPEGE